MTAEFRANDPVQVGKRQQKAKLVRENQDADLKALLVRPEFRRFLWQLINERCQVMQSPFNPNGSTQTLNIGRQDVGRELWAAAERVDPKAIPLMMAEYAEAQKA